MLFMPLYSRYQSFSVFYFLTPLINNIKKENYISPKNFTKTAHLKGESEIEKTLRKNCFNFTMLWAKIIPCHIYFLKIIKVHQLMQEIKRILHLCVHFSINVDTHIYYLGEFTLFRTFNLT